MAPRWRKVIRDLFGSRGRTVLVVLSVAVGVFAVGMIAGTQTLLGGGLTSTYLASNPASATIQTVEGFGDDLVRSVEAMPEVAYAQGRRQATVRLRTGPDSYRDLQLTAVPDFDDMPIRTVERESGAWPPPNRSLLVERSAVGLLGATEGDEIRIKTPSGLDRTLQVAGVAHDVSRPPAFIEGVPYGFVTFETLEWLGESRTYNELDITVAEQPMDGDHVKEVGEAVRAKVERSGRRVWFLTAPPPGRHPLDSIVNTVMLLLGSVGGLALLLSGFLVVNTVAALLAQQTRQIGVMKALGARRGQIAAMYLVLVLAYGLLSLVVALPLGALGAFALSTYMAGLLNVDLPPLAMPRGVIAAQIAVALIVPCLASLAPVRSGTKVTVREALANYGLGKGHFGTSRLDQALRRVTRLPRPVLLPLRNTFRRKARLALTLATLTLAGGTFIAVFSVRESMRTTLANVLELWHYHVLVSFDRPYRGDRVVGEAMAVPGAANAEGWGFNATRFSLDDDTESGTVFLFATPAETKLLVPEVLQGRWLIQGDENALVLNTKALREAGAPAIGDEVTLTLNGEESTWRLVGVIQAPGPDAFAYVNYPYYGKVTDTVGRAASVLVVAKDPSQAGQVALAADLERRYQSQGLRVASALRISQEIEEAEASFGILVTLLLIMAVLLAVVGGLGLTGTMSLNVIERTREIGVMRAIGASDRHVLAIVMTEGLVIGLGSALIGMVVAWPIGKVLSDAVGRTFMESPLAFTYPWNGVVLWFVLVIILACASSALPAWNATRVSVREVLAYE